MAMNDYPLEEKCMLVITPELAAAVQIKDTWEGGIYDLPAAIKSAMDAGRTAWECANDPALKPSIEEAGWDSVSDAYDLIQSAAGDTGMVYCSEFTGTASVPEEFAKYGGAEKSFDDAYIAGLAPLHAPGLFKAAYASPDELLKEFRDRLGDLAGPDVPLGRFVRDVSGTYLC